MQGKISLKLSLYITGGIILVLSGAYVYLLSTNIISQAPYTEPIPIPPTISQALQDLIDARSKMGTSSQLSSGLPISLKIPVINVDATFEYVGLTSGGAMAVPKGPNDVAWFDLGPRPGDIGSAVVAGHYGWKDNIPAVFDNLSKLHIGDKIYVVDDKGATTIFIVSELGTYTENGNSTNVFDSKDGKSHLNLITCEGIWNAAKKSYSNRLVVFSDKENQ